MEDSHDPRRVRRPFMLAAVTLVAAAALLVLGLMLNEKNSADIDGLGRRAVVTEPAEFVPAPEEARGEEASDRELAAEALPPADVAPAQPRSEPTRVIILPTRLESPDPAAEAFVEALLDNVETENEIVRRTVLNLLTRQVDTPEVRLALENLVEEQPEVAAEYGIAEALGMRSPAVYRAR